MIALVDTDEQVLLDIAASLHEALVAADNRYNAEKYGVPIQHPTEPKFGLIMTQQRPFCDTVNEVLTPAQKENIEYMGADWGEE